VLAGYSNICRACVCFGYLLASMKLRVFWDVLPCSQMSTDVSEVRAASIIRAMGDDGGSTDLFMFVTLCRNILNCI
jgi:hypothetical protein